MHLTWPQAFKVWWSFVWRHIVLLIPLFVVLFILVMVLAFALRGSTPPGEKPNVPLWVGAVVYLVSIPSSVVIQVASIKWALKTEWSDFRLVVTPAEAKPDNT